MSEGIIVKVWNIKAGSMGRGAGIQISDSIDYITNSEKCSEKLSSDSLCQIGRELRYVTNDVKTLEGLYVGGKNISDISNAVNEMMQIKEFHGKTGGRVALHGIISLDKDESDKKNAGKLMLLLSDLLDEVFPGYQAIYAVHTNTENLHIHFIVNTVGMNGRKIHMDKSFMSQVMEPTVNRLAERYGFSPNKKWKKEKVPDEITFSKRMMMLRNSVDEAIERSDDFDSFIKDLKGQGLIVNCGKHLSLKAEGMTRAVRSHRLGSRYTIEMIRDRILNKREEMIRSEVFDHTKQKDGSASVYFKSSPLRKYKDMSDREKKECIHQLKLGRNPWRERHDSNWQIQRLSEEFKRTAGVYELISIYAPESKNVDDALENIKTRQQLIAKEKKAVRESIRSWQPVIRLYREMQKYEVRAYLYEFAGCDEYLQEYLSYKTLSERLMNGYSKTVDEVAAFLEDQENQILYANAQAKELSEEYRTILRFKRNELKESTLDYVSLYEAIGYSKARAKALEHSVFESNIKYIAADGADGGYLRVVITPDFVDGKKTETASVTVMDSEGKQLDFFSSRDLSVKEFNQRINETKGDMGFYKCHIFDKEEDAKSYAVKQGEEKRQKSRRRVSDL